MPNLQILEGTENRVKSDKSLKEWLKIYKNKNNIKYIPNDICNDYNNDFYELYNFDKFYEKRKELMLKILVQELL